MASITLTRVGVHRISSSAEDSMCCKENKRAFSQIALYVSAIGLCLGALAATRFELILSLSVGLTIALIAAVAYTLFQPPRFYKLRGVDPQIVELLTCPVSQAVFSQPVIHRQCGVTFELWDAMEWVTREFTCPTCKVRTTPGDFVTNWLILGALNHLEAGGNLEDFVKKHRFHVRVLSEGHSYALRQVVLEQRARVAEEREWEVFSEQNKADLCTTDGHERGDVDCSVLKQLLAEPPSREQVDLRLMELYTESIDNLAFKGLCDHVQKQMHKA